MVGLHFNTTLILKNSRILIFKSFWFFVSFDWSSVGWRQVSQVSSISTIFITRTTLQTVNRRRGLKDGSFQTTRETPFFIGYYWKLSFKCKPLGILKIRDTDTFIPRYKGVFHSSRKPEECPFYRRYAPEQSNEVPFLYAFG
jgi:hypothetical protein